MVLCLVIKVTLKNMKRLTLHVVLLMIFVCGAFGQAAEKKTIRWASPDLPKECCTNYMEDGALVTTYRDANLFYVVSLHTNIDDKYVMALIYFRNTGDVPITIYPENFQLRLSAPINKTLNSLDAAEFTREIEKRGKGGRILRGFLAGMARNTSNIDTLSSGRVRATDSNGNTASGTYSGESTSTVSTPDFEARRRAREKNEKEIEQNEAKASHFASVALLANTLRKDETTGGIVFFKKDKFSPGAILSFRIGDITYEIPYGTERTK